MSDTGEIVQTDAEAEIERAYHVENDPAKANALYLKSIGVDAEVGPDPEDDGDAAESLPDVGPVPDGEWTFSRPEVTDYQFKLMEAEFGELATDLKSDWGADAGRNFEFALAMSREFEAHYPELVETVVARGARNDPLIVELLAVLGRQWAETSGDPTTVRLFPGSDGHGQERNMNQIDTDNFDEKTDDLLTEQAQAQATGNLGKVNRIERELRALFVRRYGTTPAVGSSGGPTV